MRKIAVILAGCGRLDGSEIHESVLTLLAIKQNNANYLCFSLDLPQDHVSNHLNQQDMPQEKRNMLVESARIARGDIKPLEQLNTNDFNALIIPGGNGVAYNLFNYASSNKDYIVNSMVKKKCLEFTQNNKPVGFICIAPVMIPKIYSNAGVEMTIGNDKTMIDMINSLGAKHIECNSDEIHIDQTHKIVTTPAYMNAQHIGEAYIGIRKLVDAIVMLST